MATKLKEYIGTSGSIGNATLTFEHNGITSSDVQWDICFMYIYTNHRRSMAYALEECADNPSTFVEESFNLHMGDTIYFDGDMSALQDLTSICDGFYRVVGPNPKIAYAQYYEEEEPEEEDPEE